MVTIPVWLHNHNTLIYWKIGVREVICLLPDYKQLVMETQSPKNSNDFYVVSWEPEGLYQHSKMFHWEPEGYSRHRLFTAMAPFWFSMEHLWILIAPFWLSTDDIYNISVFIRLLSSNLLVWSKRKIHRHITWFRYAWWAHPYIHAINIQELWENITEQNSKRIINTLPKQFNNCDDNKMTSFGWFTLCEKKYCHWCNLSMKWMKLFVGWAEEHYNTLLNSDITRRDHVSVVMDAGSRIVNFIRDGSLRILWNIQHWCACAVVTREPWNHDNGASDVWALTANCILNYIPDWQQSFDQGIICHDNTW